jgi:hypothetical protein
MECNKMAISEKVKKSSTEAIRSAIKTDNKWKAAGDDVGAEYVSAEAFTTIKNEYLDEVVYPAMGDEAVRIMRAVVPRSNSKEFKAAGETQQAAWAELGKAKISVRGMGSSYFARVRKYAFGETEADDETETEGETEAERTLRAVINEGLAALIKKCQKADPAKIKIDCDIGQVVAALEKVQGVLAKPLYQ